MKTFSLPYGKGTQEVQIPEEHILYDLHGSKVQAVSDETAAVLAAIRNPIGSEPLKDIVKPADTVAIVVSDITRLVHTNIMLPVIVRELNDAGIPDQQISVVIATGTHRAHTPEENITVCGKEMVERLHIVQHDCNDQQQMAYIGTTSLGNKIYLNKAVVNADKVILTGAVSFHPMAGYGGGRKAVVPGVAAFDTIMKNHAGALTKEAGGGCNPACDTGKIKGNPFAEDMEEACAMLNPAFLVNTVFTTDGELYEVVAGHWDKAFKKGCVDLLNIASVEIHELADVTIASVGGYPKDLNLYQATKAHMNAIFATKPGGIMIFTLECPDIKEPAVFTDWFFRNDMDGIEADLRKEFNMAGFVAFKSHCIINSMNKVYVVTLPQNFDIIREGGQIPAHTLAEAWQLAQAELKKQGCADYKVTIMGHAAATLPVLK